MLAVFCSNVVYIVRMINQHCRLLSSTLVRYLLLTLGGSRAIWLYKSMAIYIGVLSTISKGVPQGSLKIGLRDMASVGELDFFPWH